MLKAFNLFLLPLVLTRHAHQPTKKNVRFKVQTYTDRGPTTKFKNEYNWSVIYLKIDDISITPIDRIFSIVSLFCKQHSLEN